MKRFLTIAIIIILVVGIILTGAWLVARRTAQKNGNEPLSFRDFLTGETTVAPTGTNTGTDTSVFVDDNLSTTPSSNGGQSTIGTNVSQFTNGTTTPAGTSASNGTGSTGTSSNGTSTGSAGGQGNATNTGTTTVIGGTTTADSPISIPTALATEPECSDSDLNITFTADEQAKLQALQTRFYTVAQTLRTDTDAATELANYGGFKVKAEQLKDLLSYCQSVAPKITNAVYKKKVPTPFWYVPSEIRRNTAVWYGYDPVTDLSTTEQTASGVPLGYISESGQVGGLQEGTADKSNGIRSIEQVLRLNLW